MGQSSPVSNTQLAVVLGVIFCDALNQFLIFPFVPFLVRDQLKLPADHPNVPLFSGLLAAAYLFGQFACSPFYGALSERLGRRPVLLVCVFISTCFLVAFGLSESYLLSVVIRLLQGAFAGALTVGKLYLADVTDATNEGRVFSYIGIAIGSGCITGPAIGGYLADPSLLGLVPADTAIGAVIRAYPYLAPCAAGALLSILIFAMAVVNLKESRQPAIPLFRSFSKTQVGPTTTPLASPLLANPQPGASAVVPPMRAGLMPARTYSAGWGSPGAADGGLSRASYSAGGGAGGVSLVRRESSSALLEAMAGMAGRSSLVVDDEQRDSSITSSPAAPSPTGSSHASHESSPKPVNAVTLAMKHSLSPKAQRLELFSRGSGNSSSHASPAASTVRIDTLHEEEEVEGLSEAARQSVFWLIQLSCFLFTLTNVGLTEVLPVWLSTPADSTGLHPGAGGLNLSPYVIGNLQSTTGIGNIVLALFVTFRIIAAIGPVRTFAISLAINAAAAFGPPVIQMLPDGIPEPLQLGLMCVSYSLVAASRNMMFSTAIMLSKEAATGAPGVAIGINQSACSLGGACGPMLTGFAYTQSLRVLFACTPFFMGVGILGATPAVLMFTRAPPWPWKNHDLLQPRR